jgi:hypothetical protein
VSKVTYLLSFSTAHGKMFFPKEEWFLMSLLLAITVISSSFLGVV